MSPFNSKGFVHIYTHTSKNLKVSTSAAGPCLLYLNTSRVGGLEAEVYGPVHKCPEMFGEFVAAPEEFLKLEIVRGVLENLLAVRCGQYGWFGLL